MKGVFVLCAVSLSCALANGAVPPPAMRKTPAKTGLVKRPLAKPVARPVAKAVTKPKPVMKRAAKAVARPKPAPRQVAKAPTRPKTAKIAKTKTVKGPIAQRKPVSIPKSQAVKKPVLTRPARAAKPTRPAARVARPTRKVPVSKPVLKKSGPTREPIVKRQPVRNGPKNAAEEPAKQPETGSTARTESQYEAAMEYMEAQEPIEESGGKPIEDLLAADSEAREVEPYERDKFMKAREAHMKGKKAGEKDTEQLGCSDAPKSLRVNLAVLLSVISVMFI